MTIYYTATEIKVVTFQASVTCVCAWIAYVCALLAFGEERARRKRRAASLAIQLKIRDIDMCHDRRDYDSTTTIKCTANMQ